MDNTYTFQVVIREGNNEWWEETLANRKTGITEVTELLKDILENHGVDATIDLLQFNRKGS